MTTPKRNIIAIVGTTGVGKSKFSIELAKAVNGEIINADSMQVYRGLDVITNKHPHDERDGVAHHVMDYVDWEDEYFIHKFSEDANKAIEQIHSEGKVPIIIGGTHYYLQKLLFNNKTVSDGTKREEEVTEAQKAVLDGPIETLFETLQSVDPVIAEKFHPQDRRKLRRALEIYYTMGELPSKIYEEQKLDELEDSSLRYNTLLFWVYSETEILQRRLDERVDKMMEIGAVEEIKELHRFYQSMEQKPDFTRGVWQVIGFKEFLPWLQDATAKNYAAGLERMKIRTRQYAKYQVKWIKKLLLVELMKESRFNFKYGGKLYLLNSSDLDNWHDSVQQRGITIAHQFINGGPTSVTEPQKPSDINQDIFPDEKTVSSFNSNKRMESVNNWKHYKCGFCKDKQGNALVSVGTDSWNIHVSSRRHKKNVKHASRPSRVHSQE